ncbi:SGNH/GDSL hydrolase family protein [Candidatus Halobonum tyrrellensis]|uniref:SGNH hydrolase-type esterase domain-containing protein n=1 Tax=Candidatus Halobonum tyrrellensis G22 TaxID=1324957 RepID=V4HH52_9EURY|nr:SGNH/GDSL hydrolase family protein [Candidatus Halobonum tyrrellensis]ESP90075.1 hypothetical protein K933_00892 [Candidatus Halobonum tyrrellensis G22]
MRYDDRATLHNVAETVETDEGLALARVPRAVRADLNEQARDNYRRPSGVEIRLVAEGDARVTLSCPDGECEVTPFWGPFQTGPDERVTVGAEPTTVEVSFPDRLADLESDAVDEASVSPRVCRLVLRGNPTLLRGIEGETRPPRAAELPDRTYLAYGTSITQGAVATDHPSTYVAETARRVNADLLNLGTGGSAFCEPAIADYIAGRDDWDVATLAVSVNMLAEGFTAAEFRERAVYLLETVAGENPDRPVLAVTLFPVYPDVCSGYDDEWEATPDEYRTALREVVADSPHANVHLAEGEELLDDVAGLSPDLVHPTDRGMGVVAGNLAPRLAALLE